MVMDLIMHGEKVDNTVGRNHLTQVPLQRMWIKHQRYKTQKMYNKWKSYQLQEVAQEEVIVHF